MRRLFAATLTWGTIVGFGCGGPGKGVQDTLNNTVSNLAQSDAVDPTSSSFAEVKRLNDSANRFAAQGDEEAAAHFRRLTEVQIEIAKAEKQREQLAAEVEITAAKKREGESKIEALQTEIAEKKLASERSRIRTLVTASLDESRRKAAADEAYRARFNGETARSARLQVGRQMLIRGAVLRTAVEVYAARGLIQEADITALNMLADSAEQALSAPSPDLFAIQTMAENLSATGQRLVEDAWTAAPSLPTFDAARRKLEEGLQSRDIGFTPDSPGVRVNLETGKNGRPGDAVLSKIATLYKSLPPFATIVLLSLPGEKDAVAAVSTSRKRASSAAESLISLGISETDIRSLGCGTALPFLPDDEKKHPWTLYLLPIPGAHDPNTIPNSH